MLFAEAGAVSKKKDKTLRTRVRIMGDAARSFQDTVLLADS